mmetsp:Transcript_31091/g.60013  ORF Transcript_31091/g.60013 Transcript_31091/m.60013 type:complete len:209 (+) Transcript_31091:1140-1766(+)
MAAGGEVRLAGGAAHPPAPQFHVAQVKGGVQLGEGGGQRREGPGQLLRHPLRLGLRAPAVHALHQHAQEVVPRRRVKVVRAQVLHKVHAEREPVRLEQAAAGVRKHHGQEGGGEHVDAHGGVSAGGLRGQRLLEEADEQVEGELVHVVECSQVAHQEKHLAAFLSNGLVHVALRVQVHLQLGRLLQALLDGVALLLGLAQRVNQLLVL